MHTHRCWKVGGEMGRRAKYTEQDILDGALELVAEDGTHAASVVAIAKP